MTEAPAGNTRVCGTGPDGDPGSRGVHQVGQSMDEGLRWFGNHFFRVFLLPFSALGVSPNLITCMGIGAALTAGWLLSTGRVAFAGAVFVVSGVLDLVDGFVAKKLDRVSAFGSFLDSFSDRISDAAIFTGLMVYFLGDNQGLYAGLALAIMVLSFLISYVRAKAESLDIECKAGLMARAPRIIALSVGFFFNGLSPWLLRGVMWLLALLLLETLIERFVHVWKELSRPGA